MASANNPLQELDSHVLALVNDDHFTLKIDATHECCRAGFKTLIEYLAPFEKVAICELPVSYRGWLARAIDGLS